MQDLAELDGAVRRQDSGAVVEILHMDRRTPLGFSVRVAGPESQRALDARHAMTADLVEIGTLELSDEQRHLIESRYLSRVSVQFEGGAPVVLDGAPLEATQADFEKLYTRFAFIRDQVERAHYRRSDFLLLSGGSFSPGSTEQQQEISGGPQRSDSESGKSSGA